MQVILTPQESEDFFHRALCNSLSCLGDYNVYLRYKNESYNVAKDQLQEENPDAMICYEDVIMKILKNGKKIFFKDEEDEENTKTVTLKDVHEKVQTTPFRYLVDMNNEEDDADTGDAVLQTVLYGDIIYG